VCIVHFIDNDLLLESVIFQLTVTGSGMTQKLKNQNRNEMLQNVGIGMEIRNWQRNRRMMYCDLYDCN